MPLSEYIESTKLKECENAIGYSFQQKDLLIEALMHSSMKNTCDTSYERMEFLGDSILQFQTSLRLYQLYPNYQEGSLTKSLSNIVSAKSLYKIASLLELEKFIIVAPNLQSQISASMLSDIYESIIAAIYLDGGLDPAIKFIENTIEPLLKAPLQKDENYKSILQEYCQKNKLALPRYEVIKQEGPDHELEFKMVLYIDQEKFGPVKAKTKKIAEQMVAKKAIKSLKIKI